MPFLFPANPLLGQTYSHENISWEYTGYAWKKRGITGGVSAITAGTAISISSSTGNVTITNVGVQSFDGLTGAINIVDGGTY
jgi:hypothetical protein